MDALHMIQILAAGCKGVTLIGMKFSASTAQSREGSESNQIFHKGQNTVVKLSFFLFKGIT